MPADQPVAQLTASRFGRAYCANIFRESRVQPQLVRVRRLVARRWPGLRCGAADASGEFEQVAFIRPPRHGDAGQTRDRTDANVPGYNAGRTSRSDHDLDPDVPDPAGPARRGRRRGQFRIIMEMVSMSGAKIYGGIIEHQRTSFIDNRALTNIEPTAFDSRWYCIRPTACTTGPSNSTTMGQDDPDGGWGPIVSDLEIVHIGGDHLSMVDEPYISAIRADPTARLNGLGKTKRGGRPEASPPNAPRWPTTGPTTASPGARKRSANEHDSRPLADLRSQAGNGREPGGAKAVAKRARRVFRRRVSASSTCSSARHLRRVRCAGQGSGRGQIGLRRRRRHRSRTRQRPARRRVLPRPDGHGGSVGEMFGRKVCYLMEWAGNSAALSSASTTPAAPASRTPWSPSPGTARWPSTVNCCPA